MALSNDLISQFVKVTKDEKQTTNESTAYGKIIKQGDTEYVQLDGSDLLTPITSTTVVKDGDRVMVTIKNHTAIVTGDLTNPSANDEDVKEIGNKISEFEIVIADKVNTEQLEAEIAKIEQLRVEDLTATNAKFETIEAEVAKIDNIETDILEVNQKITAHEGEFTTIRGEIADFENLTAENFEAVEGSFNTLNSDYANFKVTTTNTLNAHEGNFDTINSDIADFKTLTTDKIEAIEGDFDKLNADHASFKETTTNKLTANKASITELETKKLDVETAKVAYAYIDFSNIKEAAVEKLFTDSGIIKDLVMNEGKVTGELVGVTIKGDLIEGNTLKADKLVILGTDGLYYKLNVNALGETTASSDPKYQNGLDGSAIVAKSITAEKVAVTDLVAFGATIGGYHITNNSLYSGVKGSISNTNQGVFLGDDGQINIGDINNYLKFFIDEDGVYKLELQANTIRFGTNNSTIDDAIDSAISSNNEGLSEANTNLNERINKADTLIEQLSNMISHLVTDANGESLMTQTSNGWTFNMSSINGNLNAIKDAMVEMESDQNSSNSALEKLTNLVNEVVNKTAYITMATDDNGDPCIELGKNDSLFKVRITNQAIDFLEGSTKIAYANNNTFYTETMIVKNELQIGEGPGFAWRTRPNGNMGLTYISAPGEIDAILWDKFFKITAFDGTPVINNNPMISFAGTTASSLCANLSERNKTYSSYTTKITYQVTTLNVGQTIRIEFNLNAVNIYSIKIGINYTPSDNANGKIKGVTITEDSGLMTDHDTAVYVTNETDSAIAINGIKLTYQTLNSSPFSVNLKIKSLTIT